MRAMTKLDEIQCAIESYKKVILAYDGKPGIHEEYFAGVINGLSTALKILKRDDNQSEAA